MIYTHNYSDKWTKTDIQVENMVVQQAGKLAITHVDRE